MTAALILSAIGTVGSIIALLRLAYMWGYANGEIDATRREDNRVAMDKALNQRWN